MEDNKKKILIFSVLLAFIVIIIVIVNILIGHKASSYLIVDGKLILEKKGHNWQQQSAVTKEMLNYDYIVDSGNIKYEKAKLNYDFNNKKWYYMDGDYKSIDADKVRIAYYNSYHIKLASLTNEYANADDLSLLEEVLSDYNIEDYTQFISNTRKTIVDYDQDGTDEIIYTTHNISLSDDGQKHVSALFVVKNNQVIQVIDINNGQPYWIMEILDLNNDGKYEVIVNKGDIDLKTFQSCYQIYELNDSKLTLKQDCILKTK